MGDTSYGRQRIIFEDGHLLIIVHEPPKADDITRQAKVFWRKPSGEIQCNGQDNGDRQLRAFLDNYESKLKAMEALYEEAKRADDYFKLVEELLPVQRAVANTASALQAAREQVKQDRFLIELRDRSYELSRNFELLLGDTKMAMDYHIARKAEEQVAQANKAVEAQHRLNILAAVFFPLTAIATIFGMNLQHGFESTSPFVFWGVFFVGIVTGLALKGWVVKVPKSPGP
nr:CorA family divalent cation transporter [Cerasicoccus arenae]